MPEYQLDVKCDKGNFKTEWSTDKEEITEVFQMFLTRLPLDTKVTVAVRHTATTSLR